ncbi:hypothetical protein HDU87_005498 [Geranomyces variabilis]|uniref:Uncharacterized protein n=1 Tax=Geranomyces variabilis TaxID=109894 RepID=A0AAD5TJ46_9FUNG|nr:hypothetical protein HDU87_005498 [Geranomyces variabilis]
MVVYSNQYSAIFAAAQPDCLKKFEITVDDSTPRVPARAGVHIEKPTAGNLAVEATLTVEVKKPTVVAAVQWIFEGLEYARIPITGELCDQHLQSTRQLIRKTGLLVSQPKTFVPGETYKYPICFSIPANTISSHRSEYAGVRYSLGAALLRDSTVAITAPSYIILNEQSRIAQTIKLELIVVSGSTQLTSAKLEFREYIPCGYRSTNSAHGAVLDPVLATNLQSAGRFEEKRMLLNPEEIEFPAPAFTATIPVEIPAGAYMVWRDDIDTGAGGYVKCSHWFDLVIKGIENGKKREGKAIVRIGVHGAWSCTVKDMSDYWEA